MIRHKAPLTEELLNDYIENIQWRTHENNKDYLVPLLEAFKSKEQSDYAKYLKYGCSRTLALNYATFKKSQEWHNDLSNFYLDDADWLNSRNLWLAKNTLIICPGLSIRIWESDMGFFSYGIALNYHHSGQHFAPSIWTEKQTSYHDALDTALAYVTSLANRNIGKTCKRTDSDLRNLKKGILLFKAESMQLSMF